MLDGDREDFYGVEVNARKKLSLAVPKIEHLTIGSKHSASKRIPGLMQGFGQKEEEFFARLTEIVHFNTFIIPFKVHGCYQ